MLKNSNLHKANKAKKDEFYTRLSDIEKELKFYRNHFKGKTILCNCNDPYESNFFKYFAMNFKAFGLKKLIATCYAGSPVADTQLSLFGTSHSKVARTEAPHKIAIDEIPDLNGMGASIWRMWKCS
ncbi:MAG: adenine-specific methyltransferase EcoRI family protein [Fibrobacteraceae bacterium]|nr:adenine-specific methyltransferase EcoRI family protein [Fibrobacteraceae bacterium]